jgi:hypothetical protein
MACQGTFLAVVGFVLFAFVAAGFTNLCAEPTDILGESRVTTQPCRRVPTDLGAIPVQPDTFGHFGDVLLAQTGIRAMLALLGALDTGFDAGLILLVGHDLSLLEKVLVGRSAHTSPAKGVPGPLRAAHPTGQIRPARGFTHSSAGFTMAQSGPNT